MINPFTKIYEEVKENMLVELRKILPDLNPHVNTETHAVTNKTQIYTGGVDPIEGIHPTWEEVHEWEQEQAR